MRYGNQGEPPEHRPDREPGDPKWRCLWCMAWACDFALTTCPACDAWYAEAAVGMPEEQAEIAARRVCGVEGCHKLHHAGGMCEKHYYQARYQRRRERRAAGA